MKRAPSPRRARIQSLVRANAILNAIAEAPEGAARITEICRATGLHKNTAATLIDTLHALGFVERDRATRHFRLGQRMLQLGRLVHSRLDISTLSRPALIRLCNATRETVNLAAPDLFDAVVVNSFEGAFSVRATAYTGWRIHYHASALGKAMLAFFDEPTRTAILQARPLVALTANTVTSIPRLEEQLRAIRETGQSVDLEEAEIGARAVAAPMIDPYGDVVGAISVSGPASRLPTPVLHEIGRQIRAEIEGIMQAYA